LSVSLSISCAKEKKKKIVIEKKNNQQEVTHLCKGSTPLWQHVQTSISKNRDFSMMKLPKNELTYISQ
jgi:hypothetical protein